MYSIPETDKNALAALSSAILGQAFPKKGAVAMREFPKSFMLSPGRPIRHKGALRSQRYTTSQALLTLARPMWP
jgi:hypothetical protein